MTILQNTTFGSGVRPDPMRRIDIYSFDSLGDKQKPVCQGTDFYLPRGRFRWGSKKIKGPEVCQALEKTISVGGALN